MNVAKNFFIIALIVLLFVILLGSIAFSKSSFDESLSDYPDMSALERTIIASEFKEAAKFGADVYDLETIIEFAKKKRISPLGLKNIVSFINQSIELGLQPSPVIDKVKEGLDIIYWDILGEKILKQLK